MFSVIMNLINAALIAGAVIAACRTAPKGQLNAVFRYFTVLSNLFCAAASVAVAAARLLSGAVEEPIPLWLSLVKFVSTSAVTVTFLTVVFFLMPKQGGPGELFKKYNFFMHFLCPVLAIVSYLLWDKVRSPFPAVFLGILPVLLYGAWYMYHVIAAPEERRWDDFYGFTRNGKWGVALGAMLAASFAISFILWIV